MSSFAQPPSCTCNLGHPKLQRLAAVLKDHGYATGLGSVLVERVGEEIRHSIAPYVQHKNQKLVDEAARLRRGEGVCIWGMNDEMRKGRWAEEAGKECGEQDGAREREHAERGDEPRKETGEGGCLCLFFPQGLGLGRGCAVAMPSTAGSEFGCSAGTAPEGLTGS